MTGAGRLSHAGRRGVDAVVGDPARAGALVLVAVTALLELLRRAASEVDDRVTQAWVAGRQVAQNTQAAHILRTTKVRSSELVQELERHRTQGGTTA